MMIGVQPLDKHVVDGQLMYHDVGPTVSGREVHITPDAVTVDDKVVLTRDGSRHSGGSGIDHPWVDSLGSAWTTFHVIITEGIG